MWVRARIGSIIFIASMFAATSARAAAPREDVEAVAAKALSWALTELAGAKAIPAAATLNVVDYNLPQKAEIKLPGRTIVVSSLVRLQATADLKESLPAFIFSSIAVHGDSAKVSISLKLVASVKTDPKPPEVEGAVLALRRGDQGWEVTTVNERWP